MKTLSLSENIHWTEQSGLRRLLWAILLVVGAAFLGWNVAHEKWLLLAGLAGLPLLAMWPVPLALGVFVFLVPFDGVAVIGGKGGLALTFVAGGMAAVVLLVTGFLRRRLQRPPITALWWALFIAWGAITSLWAIDQDLAVHALPTAVGTLVLYVVASSVRITREELNWVVLAAILGGVAAAAYSSHEFYSGVFYQATTAGRSSLIMGEEAMDPNVFAASLFLPLSLVVGRFFESRGWRRTLYLGMGGLIAVAIVLTMSRGAMLGLGAMIFIYFRRLGLDRRVLIPVAIVLLSLLVLPERFMVRLQNAESSGGAGRIYIWQAGLASLKHYGLFGAGLHNFGEAYSQNIGAGTRVHRFGESDAHNDYLLLAVELGPIGIGFMGLALVSALKAGRRLQDRVNQRLANSLVSYEAAAAAMLTSSFFVGMFWRKAYWLVWIMYVLVLRVVSHEADQVVEDPPAPLKVTRASQLVWNR